MAPTIIFNGTAYNSLEEMPPEVRQAYEKTQGMFADKDQNGVPDMFENQGAGQAASFNAVQFGGQTFTDPSQMPPEAREAYEKAMKRLAERFPNGLPDFFKNNSALQTAIIKHLQSGSLSHVNLDQMPPETRELFQQAMAHLSQVMADNNQNGVPDIMEGGSAAQAQLAQLAQLAQQAQMSQTAQPEQPMPPMLPSQPMFPQQPPMTGSPSALSGDVDSSSRNLKLLILGVGILLVLGALAVLGALLVLGRLG
jgi:hypothetical protein